MSELMDVRTMKEMLIRGASFELLMLMEQIWISAAVAQDVGRRLVAPTVCYTVVSH